MEDILQEHLAFVRDQNVNFNTQENSDDSSFKRSQIERDVNMMYEHQKCFVSH